MTVVVAAGYCMTVMATAGYCMTVMVIAGYYITYCYCGVLYNCGYCKVHGMTVMVTTGYV